MPLLGLFLPVKAVSHVGPRNLVTVDDLRMPLAVSRFGARGGLRSEPVEHVVHGVDIEPEHGELRCAVSVRETDRVGDRVRPVRTSPLGETARPATP
ncbi:hypothetical protein GCM10011578_018130 [Streptomyces fuscichromogenes]|uniref:Uncharacterized protein n=1 Tax=Streptomyces fuscichromogenes TaxID=1324013 RepID=A0A918CP84_9ACTN|nr:hypothetical protein GCM10011578_018130 [Streptomyces fuscichromogenes]